MCAKCGAFERGRLAWMALTRLNLARPGVRVLNLAPEPFMLCSKSRLFEGGYHAADYDPALFAKWGKPVMPLDLCSDLNNLPPGYYDVIMHNHVLEHVPCEVTTVLRGLNRAIIHGGYHLFSVPIKSNAITVEDLSSELTSAERLAAFGQEDHMRYFGDIDFLEFLKKAEMTDGMVDLSSLISSEECIAAGLPPDVFETLNSNRVFVWRKQ
ncbi:hypothetical protein [Methylocystis parvus]|uniref:Class I SAM-dependent methyltransferase n=1 Tax=Methylocystis parvus TaxID=134 RepID=A0A6B8M8C6_9HYPH|nr:hypothetical protein [Methylocystis parvus]QGM97583.1 class I SAM-dependent methyltransferase [Methylocystis parvus]WBJ98485.1 class I SAM-dependent methyltransferase [Methylocystis parvus OBBP]